MEPPPKNVLTFSKLPTDAKLLVFERVEVYALSSTCRRVSKEWKHHADATLDRGLSSQSYKFHNPNGLWSFAKYSKRIGWRVNKAVLCKVLIAFKLPKPAETGFVPMCQRIFELFWDFFQNKITPGQSKAIMQDRVEDMWDNLLARACGVWAVNSKLQKLLRSVTDIRASAVSTDSSYLWTFEARFQMKGKMYGVKSKWEWRYATGISPTTLAKVHVFLIQRGRVSYFWPIDGNCCLSEGFLFGGIERKHFKAYLEHTREAEFPLQCHDSFKRKIRKKARLTAMHDFSDAEFDDLANVLFPFLCPWCDNLVIKQFPFTGDGWKMCERWREKFAFLLDPSPY